MKRKLFALFVIFSALSCLLLAQNFSLEEYKNFLNTYKNMTTEEMYSLYPVGLFNKKVQYQSNEANYFDSINTKYNLTDFEKQLIDEHGFMVSERLSYPSFWGAYKDIWEKDLPVFITTDAILHALHMSYDAILRDLEEAIIFSKLDTLLEKLHGHLPVLIEKYKDYPDMQEMLNDYDVYFTIARTLLNGYCAPIITSNKTVTDELLVLINNEFPAANKLFSSTKRLVDFSQFTVRGHYSQTEELGRYFKSMIWLGRTEFYLIPPESDDWPKQTMLDIRRQIIDAVLINETFNELSLKKDLDDIDNIIKALVGESDNVKVEHIGELIDEINLLSITELLDTNVCKTFQNALSSKHYAEQQILSQILSSNPCSPTKIKPASAFLLFGQRFVIDSYVFSNVVFDRIIFENQKILRMLPSSLDVLFALGNNAASDLLKPELERFKYALYLSGLRYLIDSYDSDYWKLSFYNGWLNSIRTLNVPSINNREKYPEFMQTAAWWQQKMNTQLASWAQLRHDNLLYAKQSYSGSFGGSISDTNPDIYIEPIPEFYKVLSDISKFTIEKIEKFLQLDSGQTFEFYYRKKIKKYFENMNDISLILYSITQKELKNINFSSDEISFLKRVFSTWNNREDIYLYTGWYSSLFYISKYNAEKQDFVVADVHTAPTDEYGNPVGWVKHVGTGPINLAVITVKNNVGNLTSFVGPVMSYYEYTSTNFKRLTDEEWKESINELPANRPFFVNLYLADLNGQCREINPASLPVGVDDGDISLPKQITFSNYPNPFSNSTLINFTLPQSDGVYDVSIDVFDINGKPINTIFTGTIPSGNYISKWNGTDFKGARVNPGIYLYVINLNGDKYSGKMILK
ncbi:MAG: DUF3160 domain-containing protein [Bacteroidetes bacterium]|nr:MAG: DUF3160 domain-containing protein [Bacteroidota bacterium]